MSRPRTVSPREDLLPLREGDSGEAVVDLQERLERLGFEHEHDELGAYGPGTAAAVQVFQSNVDYVLMASAATRRGQALLKPAFDWETDSFTAVAQCCRETTSPTCSGG